MPKYEHSQEGNSVKHSNPDKGPPMREGAHSFDKGYMSDDELFQPTKNMFPDNNERGNEYMKLNNEWQKKDAGKLARSKFSKIA